MSIESLKQQARRHEQSEEWQKALDQYQKAIRELDDDDQTDIGLINRVGDLYVRVGKLSDAVKNYERAVDLYREAFLPNNAIAVCKKIIRNVPENHKAYLKIGQIRAEQGFLSDARTNFLTYAERMQRAGSLDESFRALVEFCDLAPDDVEVRITVADQMAANQRSAEAVQQLLVAYRQLTQSGESDRAAGVEKKIVALDPDADLSAALAAGPSVLSVDSDSGFGDIELGGGLDADAFGTEEEEEEAATPAFSMSEPGPFALGSQGEEEEAEAEEEEALPGWAAEEEEGSELPMMSFGDDSSEEEEEAVELPMMGFGNEQGEQEEEATELPTMDFGSDESEEEATELPTIGFSSDEPEEEAAELPMMDTGGDLGLTLASEPSEALEEAFEEAEPETAPEPTPAPPPPPAKPAKAADEGYVDFGAMILGGGDPKSTRFKVAYEEPTGDENADFAKMLSQFKEKVSENIDAGDVRAHYDLGTAYKEMGLLEEAISSFQAALRASSDHLPTYELMGQTFLEMGQPEAAVKALQRALQIKGGVEDEFVGIYYYLARAYEALDRKDSAVEYYDRVFSLDINFADVTERLRELR
jgi:tetratricopeptide (TPR) repeat protein